MTAERTCIAPIIGAGLILLGGCAETHWKDVTGERRGQSQFTVDSGYCMLLAQGASNRQQEIVNQQNANGCYGTARQCGTLGALQGLLIVGASGDAFDACMNAKGWTIAAVPNSTTGTSGGHGSLTYGNGDKYVGEYKENNRDGKGTYYFADQGLIYIGDWQNNLRHGIGRMIYADGGRYLGAWAFDR